MIRRYLVALTWIATSVAAAQAGASSRAPEMHVQGSTERLPLLMTRVNADIAGVIADVTLTQVYQNRGSKPIEAVYVFPVTRHAAVYAMSLRVGDRLVRADLRTREQAQQKYEAAREEGKTATLLEQSDADVVRLSIANILPDDNIEVELRYSELLVPEAGRYRFLFPNTFGDLRYGGEARVATPMQLTSDIEAIAYALSVTVKLATPVPIRALESPSHEVVIERTSPHEAVVQLSDADASAAARDFLVDFRLAGDAIETGLMVHQEGNEGWFLMLAEPPSQVQRSAVVPREYLFLLDVSGSMAGFPIETAKALMRELIGGMQPHERFNVLLFESQVKALTLGNSLAPTEQNLTRAVSAIDDQFGHGGTRLVDALDAAHALPTTPGYSRTMVVVTDGNIHAGPEVARLINTNLHNANVFAMGIGPTVSKEVVERIARSGRGEAILVAGPDEAAAKAERLRQLIDRPLLTDIALTFDDVDVFDLEPAQVPDVFAERPVVVTGRFVGTATGSMTLKGRNADGEHSQTLYLQSTPTPREQPAIKRLWARERLTSWMDARIDGQLPHAVEGRVAEVTAHALRYGLLSPWTSFVAVHEEVRTDGVATQVVQPSIRRDVGIVGGVGMARPPRMVVVEPAPESRSRPPSRFASANPVRPPSFPSATSAAPGTPQMSGSKDAGHVEGDRLQLAGLDFVWQQRRWQSVQWREGMTMLRIRPGSEAALKLLAMRPDLAPLFVRVEPVLVVLNDHAVLIGPRGFSDYPDEVLARLASRR